MSILDKIFDKKEKTEESAAVTALRIAALIVVLACKRAELLG